MSLLAASVIVIDASNRVLLTRRADFDVWCLPGGMVESGESLEEAAHRELTEEAGAVDAFDGLVGFYSEVGGWADVHIGVFATRSPFTAGPTSAEVLELGWFPVDAPPFDMFWWNRQYITDAVNGASGVTRRIDLTCRLGNVSREELYAALAAFDGTPSEFFHWCFPAPLGDS